MVFDCLTQRPEKTPVGRGGPMYQTDNWKDTIEHELGILGRAYNLSSYITSTTLSHTLTHTHLALKATAQVQKKTTAKVQKRLRNLVADAVSPLHHIFITEAFLYTISIFMAGARFNFNLWFFLLTYVKLSRQKLI